MNKEFNTQAVGNAHGFVLEEKCIPNTLKHSEQVYICSPLRSETNNGLLNNMTAAGGYAGYALKKMQYRAMALHSYLPFILDDSIPEQREEALQIGLQVLDKSDILMVCGDKLSDGMRGEIEYAAKANKKIIVFNEELFPAVLDVVAKSGASEFNVELDKENPEMATPPKEQDLSDWLKLLGWEV